MSFEIISAKLTGNPDATGWAQVYEFSPEDEEKHRLRGKLFAVISTSTKEVGMDTILAGREVLSRLHEEYFGESSGSSFSRLKISVEKVTDEFASWEDIQIACVSYVNNVFNVAAGGGARIVVLRQGDLSTILQSQSGEVQIAARCRIPLAATGNARGLHPKVRPSRCGRGCGTGWLRSSGAARRLRWRRGPRSSGRPSRCDRGRARKAPDA